MTFGMQIRYWYRHATARERQAAIGAVAIAVSLLVASVAVLPDDGDGVAADQAVTAGGLSSAGHQAGDGAIATNGSDPSGSGGTGPGAAATAGQPGTSDAAVGASRPGSAPDSGSTAVAADSAAASSGQGDAHTPVARTASDRGVTPDTIKLGFLPANLGGLSAAGFALNIRSDTDRYVQALADYVNRRGGVGGRKVEAVVRKVDPTNQSDQQAACRAMVSDYKVFGVVDVGALSDTPAFECVAIQNKTPFVHNTIWGTDWLARSGGMEVGYPAAIDRVSKTWARDLNAMGWLGKDAVVGIVGDNCVATGHIIDNVLKPEFEGLPSVKKVVVEKHDCDPQSVVSQPASFVTRFRAEGVTHVLLAANFVSVAIFAKAAENQLWRPKYSVTDWWQLTSESSAANYDPNQFDGAVGISSLGLMLPASGKPPYPGGQRCQEAATEAKLEPLAYNGRNHELWAMCDNFFLMLDGITAAGVNPTRAAWAAAIPRLGQHDSVMFGTSRFAPGKVTGSDQVHTLQWQRGCKCFRSVSGFRPAAA